MQWLNRTSAKAGPAFPEQVLQFGGGNFLRAFADWIIDEYNHQTSSDLGIVVATSSKRPVYETWQKQEGLYHILTRGFQNGKVIDQVHLVKSISSVINLVDDWKVFLTSAENPKMRFIISNTTEAGIEFNPNDQKTAAPPGAFPAKLTLWLYRRYQYFQGDAAAGCILLPTELIINNGEILRECILQYIDHWLLEAEFKNWIEVHNTFCNTLVDRIVPGIGKDMLPEVQEKLGFADALLTQGEPFHFWAIEAPESVQKLLPLDQIGLDVIFTNDLNPFRTRKVRILNGAHTSMVPVGYLYGIETVREAVEDPVVGAFIQQVIFKEIIPSLDLPEDELISYSNSILDRFRNPFIKHQLISISLNAISKFKTRVLPSILEFYKKKGHFPSGLVFSMAATIHFYKGEKDGATIPLNDDAANIQFLKDCWADFAGTEAGMVKLAKSVLSWEAAWGEDLSGYDGFQELLVDYLG